MRKDYFKEPAKFDEKLEKGLSELCYPPLASKKADKKQVEFYGFEFLYKKEAINERLQKITN